MNENCASVCSCKGALLGRLRGWSEEVVGGVWYASPERALGITADWRCRRCEESARFLTATAQADAQWLGSRDGKILAVMRARGTNIRKMQLQDSWEAGVTANREGRAQCRRQASKGRAEELRKQECALGRSGSIRDA